MLNYAGALKAAMKKKPITQAGLADAAGLSRASISLFASGKARPGPKAKEKIEAALGFALEEIDEPALPTSQKRVSVSECAKRIGKSPMFVMMALRSGRAPFGFASKASGEKWSYHISPKLLEAYIGSEAL